MASLLEDVMDLQGKIAARRAVSIVGGNRIEGDDRLRDN